MDIFGKMSPKYTRNNDFTEKTAQNAASGVFPEIFLPKLHPFCQNGCISAKKNLRVTPDARFFVKKRAKSMDRVYIARKKISELHPITCLPDANAYFGRFLLSGSWPGASGNDAAGLADHISMANGQTT